MHSPGASTRRARPPAGPARTPPTLRTTTRAGSRSRVTGSRRMTGTSRSVSSRTGCSAIRDPRTCSSIPPTGASASSPERSPGGERRVSSSRTEPRNLSLWTPIPRPSPGPDPRAEPRYASLSVPTRVETTEQAKHPKRRRSRLTATLHARTRRHDQPAHATWSVLRSHLSEPEYPGGALSSCRVAAESSSTREACLRVRRKDRTSPPRGIWSLDVFNANNGDAIESSAYSPGP